MKRVSKVLIVIVIIISIFFVAIKFNMKKPSFSNEKYKEPILLSFNSFPKKISKGKKVKISFNSIIEYENLNLNNIYYVIEPTRNGKRILKEDVILLCEKNKLLEKDNLIFKDGKYNIKLPYKKYNTNNHKFNEDIEFYFIFNKEGKYDFKIYALDNK